MKETGSSKRAVITQEIAENMDFSREGERKDPRSYGDRKIKKIIEKKNFVGLKEASSDVS